MFTPEDILILSKAGFNAQQIAGLSMIQNKPAPAPAAKPASAPSVVAAAERLPFVSGRVPLAHWLSPCGTGGLQTATAPQRLSAERAEWLELSAMGQRPFERAS